MAQTFNYHTHTYRCGHATGTAREYIESAILANMTTIGFSEHMGYEGWDDKSERLDYLEIDEYIDELVKLKEEYKDKIKVRIGFECEYFKDREHYLLEMKNKCDYMICGQHAYDRKPSYYDHAPFYEDNYIEEMANQVCRGIEIGLFRYIAHPDYFMLAKQDFSEGYAKAIRKIAICAKEHDAVIEINLKGTKYGRRYYEGVEESYLYPNKNTYQIIGEVGCKVCFGYDAHHPKDLLKQQLELKLKEEFKDYNLQYIEQLDL